MGGVRAGLETGSEAQPLARFGIVQKVRPACAEDGGSFAFCSVAFCSVGELTDGSVVLTVDSASFGRSCERRRTSE